MRHQDKVIGVDLGGTIVRGGRVEGNTIVAHSAHRISSQAASEVVLEEIYATIDEVYSPDVAGIGIGVPSVVDVEKGIVFDVENIPSWREVPLKAILEQRYQIPVHINNDANCFALGELYFGKGIGYRHMLGMVIGTGIGVGVIINGRLYSGVNCGAGEIGAIPYKERTIEYYASGSAFRNLYQEDGETLCNRAMRNEPQALGIFAELGQEIGHAIMTALYAYDPELIVLGGSVSKSLPFFEHAMYEKLNSFAFPRALKKLRISCSEVPHIAILGAAGLVWDRYGERVY